MQITTLLTSLLAATTLSSAATLRRVLNFGSNPGDNEMYIYVPDQLPANPAIVVALHGCLGTATNYYREVEALPPAADAHGFIIIYPGSRDDFRCWDVNTEPSLTHNGGSDSLSIVNMVRYTVARYNTDTGRVFATGSSSGAMMTLVLAAAYPDVFRAVAAYSGLPYGCLRGSPGSSPFTANPGCADGDVVKSQEEWVDEVHRAWPGYSGNGSYRYPRVQVWHGTADGVISEVNFGEVVKQWSGVFGVGKVGEEDDTPVEGYSRWVYGDGDQLEGYLAQGVGHVVPTEVESTLRWFGLVQ
ncbi:Alpha/Beta hydrolase protein [Aspergillus crustosus]